MNLVFQVDEEMAGRQTFWAGQIDTGLRQRIRSAVFMVEDKAEIVFMEKTTGDKIQSKIIGELSPEPAEPQ